MLDCVGPELQIVQERVGLLQRVQQRRPARVRRQSGISSNLTLVYRRQMSDGEICVLYYLIT